MELSRPLRPAAVPSPRPWAGSRLGQGVGELWVAGPASVVTLGGGARVTLDGLAASAGEALVGTAGIARLGRRFPLLAKLIDAADWLSLQVHPDDALARRLSGEGAVGKDEVWVVLGAGRDSRLVIGPAPGRDPADVVAAIAAGSMGLRDCELVAPEAGQTFDVRAGTVHAIGPGTFVYELEQPSDLTFRISDWGRPATSARRLHTEEARQAVAPSQRAQLAGRGWALDGGALEGRHLRLELLPAAAGPARRSTAGRSPEIVTAVGGTVALAGDGWDETLAALETAVVPAAVPGYGITAAAGAVAVVGSLPL